MEQNSKKAFEFLLQEDPFDCKNFCFFKCSLYVFPGYPKGPIMNDLELHINYLGEFANNGLKHRGCRLDFGSYSSEWETSFLVLCKKHGCRTLEETKH